MRWYLSINGQVSGPHEVAQIEAWRAAGQIVPGTTACPEGGARWLPFEQTPLAVTADQREAADRRSRIVLWVTLPLVGALVLCGVVGKIVGPPSETKRSEATTAPAPTPTPTPREEATSAAEIAPSRQCLLSTGDNGMVPVFPTEEGMSEFGMAAARQEGEQALAVILVSNNGFMVAAGTACSYIDPGIIKSQVRVIEGPHVGRSGWVPAEWARGGR